MLNRAYKHRYSEKTKPKIIENKENFTVSGQRPERLRKFNLRTVEKKESKKPVKTFAKKKIIKKRNIQPTLKHNYKKPIRYRRVENFTQWNEPERAWASREINAPWGRNEMQIMRPPPGGGIIMKSVV